jgi:mannosyl-oligosaccharide alpha-1,2-mannosidase
MAYASFDTPNRMPVSRWKPQQVADGEEQLPARSVLIAKAVSASVESTRLSQITGDMRYFDGISRVTDVLDKQQGSTKLPGMWPICIDMRTPDLTFDGFFRLGAIADLAYEYLPKMHQLLNGVGPADQYRKMYEYAMTTAITHTIFRPMVEDKADILIATSNVNGERDTKGQHLACFAGGMLMLGGRLFDNDTHLDVGRKISDGCAWTYKNAPNGIMPEVFSMTACPSLLECHHTPSDSETKPFSEVNDSRYVLRPEAIKSMFYMYRMTGERKYQDIA